MDSGRRAVRREETIFEAALRLFERHGFRKVAMVEIAEAAAISRPTLYAAFKSKEAIFAALLDRDRERHDAESARRLAGVADLRAQLAILFDIWMIGPFAMVIDSPNGTDLLLNCSVYAPEAAESLYARFEARLADVLGAALTTGSPLAAPDLAHILVLAARGLKASTATLADFARLIDGLITMAVATVRAR